MVRTWMALFLLFHACEGVMSVSDADSPLQRPHHSKEGLDQSVDPSVPAPTSPDASVPVEPTPAPPPKSQQPEEPCCGDGTCVGWCRSVGPYCNPQNPRKSGVCADSDRTCVQNTHTGNWQCALKCDPCNNQCPNGGGCVSFGEKFCWPGYESAACKQP